MGHDPSLEIHDNGEPLLSTILTETSRTGLWAQLESVSVMLPLLAVPGSEGFAADQRMSAIIAVEQLGDPELAARVIGGFEVPGSWTRSDDQVLSAAIVAAALRTRSAPPAVASKRVRARLHSTVAMESRGTANKQAEAAEAELIARRRCDSALLNVLHSAPGICRLSAQLV